MYTLIINYFLSNELKTEISSHKSIMSALNQVKILRAKGIELTESNYGIYQNSGSKLQVIE